MRLRTGSTVPESGIYRVFHEQHRLPHEVTLLHGQKFPSCEKCGTAVEFELVKSAPHIVRDSSFQVTLYSLPVLQDPFRKKAS